MDFPIFYRHTLKPSSDAVVVRHDSNTETTVLTRSGERPPGDHWCLSCSLLMELRGLLVRLSKAEAVQMLENPQWDDPAPKGGQP